MSDSNDLLPYEDDPGPSEAGRDANSNPDPMHIEQTKPEIASSSQNSLSAFFSQDEIQSQIISLKSSTLSTYKDPVTNFHHIINILNVSRGKKVDRSLQQKGLGGCEILTAYTEWKEKDSFMEHIPRELEVAIRKHKSQKSIKHFFKIVGPAERLSSDTENNNSPVQAPDNVDGVSSGSSNKVATPRTGAAPYIGTSLLQVLEISEKDEKLIKAGLKIDEDLFRCKNLATKIRDMKINKAELTGKSAWEVEKSNAAAKRNFVNTELKAAKEMFSKVALLCDKEKNLEEAKDLPIEELGRFLTDKASEASSLAKCVFLRLLSKDLLDALREINHFMRRRISNIDRSFTPNPDIVFSCSKADSSWESCLQHLENIDWKPTNRNGNIRLEQFYSCAEMFKSMEFRGDEFIDSSDLLTWLKIEEKQKTALKTLVENLPILMAEKNGKIALINVATFLRTETLVEEMMTMTGLQKSNVEQFEVTEEPSAFEKPHGGSKRIVEKNPEILEQARLFAESAGVAAHSRRRTDVGRIGFNIKEITDFIAKTCFPETQELAPSQSTVRRMLEAPSLSRNSRSYYKGDISARPGVKRNDDTATGEAHPHRHECYAFVKMSREFFSLFEEECTTMSCDDKAKIPVGIPAVHRLNNLNHKFFMTDGGNPNFPDHDVLRSGCLINPQGYMILRRKQTGDCDQTTVENDTGIGSPTAATILTSDSPGSNIEQVEREQLNQSDVGSDQDQDDLQEELPEVNPTDQAISDEICQMDGAADETDESEDDFEKEMTDLFRGAEPQRKRIRTDEDVDDPNIDESEEESTQPMQTDVGGEGGDITSDDEFEMQEFPRAKFVTKNGRKHVSTPHTGPAFVFFKGHQSKPSSISRHVNDILTIASVDKTLTDKPNLLLLLDDGLDWGGRGLQTLYYLGDLWRRLNLDLLVIARNAPGDSAKNPIEHLWSPFNKKMAGLTLPAKQPDQTIAEAEDNGIEVLLRSCLKDMTYDGHAVTNVHVPASSSVVKIGESEFENDHIPADEPKLVQMIMENKKMDKRMLREKHPEIYKQLQNIFKHVDIRLHGFIFRKCHPRDHQCDFCKENPRRSSEELWKCLPGKASGGLFYDVEPDTNMPGHYRTLLDMMKDVKKIEIKPDRVFGEVFGRCKEAGCMVSFKCKADAERHFRLAHRNFNTQKNPYGHVCTFKVNNVVCGRSFETDWLLKKHKNSDNHVNRRKRGGKT